MKNKTLLALMLACSPALSFAHNLTVGQAVPAVDVSSHGEILLDGDQTRFAPWSSADLVGKVRVIQAIAGRSSAKEMNAPLMAAITAAKFPEDQYQTTSIINQDDAIWGTGSFVKSSAEDSKQSFPWSSMVLDEEGVVTSAWALAEKSSAIIVQDKQGQVLFVKEGTLSETEIETVLNLVRDNL
ncbi:YtfJ family protein [Vibrio cholerae]